MTNLTHSFRTIGARFKIRERRGPYALDVGRDRAGEFFELAAGSDAPEFHVLQAVPRERHLLLFASDGQRFLCGHDERHCFVAGIRDRISTVTEARVSLLPVALRGAIGRREILCRRNKAFVRQGEWFFVPSRLPAGVVPVVHRDEPLFRDVRSKPHICQFVVRRGGDLVHFADGRIYSDADFVAACANDPALMLRRTRSQVRNPEVYVRGYVRHPDHATVVLAGWHGVHLNAVHTTGNVTFYD